MPLDRKQSVTVFGPKDDRFELGACLDTGAQAEVFFCERRRTKITHAAKRIDLGSLERRRGAEKVRVNLQRETKIMRELHHERIVNLIEAFWEGDVCFIVMDLARGGTLHAKLEPGKGLDDEASSQHITRQLLEGMGYMHQHGVIHRDLKPANVLLTNKEPTKKGKHDIKIADFGLSRVLNDPGGAANDMTSVGTPAFAAPEIITGAYSWQADYWSLGCIVFTMLCGEYPFDEMPEHIKKKGGKVEILPCSAWEAASDNAKSVVTGLLTAEPMERLDLKSCLKHPWLQRVGLESEATVGQLQSVQSLLSLGEQPKEVRCWTGCLAALRGSRVSDQGKAVEADLSASVQGVIKSIRGWTGSSVDSIEFTYVSGDRVTRGGDGGNEYKQWSLRPNEGIVAVTQERIGDGFLGNAVVFFTTTGRTISIKGSNAAAKGRFAAPLGYEITGLHFDESRLIGLLLRKAKLGTGSVASIFGSVGYAVDALRFTLRDGGVLAYGGEGGDDKKTYKLRKDEQIIIAEQGHKDAFLGDSISLYTSTGNVYSFRGITATRSLRYMATEGNQICEIHFCGGSLHHVVTCPLSGDMTSQKTESLTQEPPTSPKTPGRARKTWS